MSEDIASNLKPEERLDLVNSGSIPLSLVTSDKAALNREVLSSVVKIFHVFSSPSFYLPWQKLAQSRSSASGFVIDGKRILTNAHAVLDSVVVHVRKHSSSRKYTARVVEIAMDIDLALLTVDDPSFWIGLRPLTLHKDRLPPLQAAIVVSGYPHGGENLSVSCGVISRIDLRAYSTSGVRLLTIQVDAAINPGSSGGPALQFIEKEWVVAGVAFQLLTGSQNIGYIIPIPVVEFFLTSIQKFGRFKPLPDFGFISQGVENESQRAYWKLPDDKQGVLVSRVSQIAPAAEVLFEGDIVLGIDNVPLGEDGTVELRDGERIDFQYLLMRKFAGEKVPIRVWRSAQEVELQLTLTSKAWLVPNEFEAPSYFIFGGLVFCPLTRQYLVAAYGRDWTKNAPSTLQIYTLEPFRSHPEEQIVILSQVLGHDVNRGFESLAPARVSEVSGVRVRNLAHLIQLVDACTERFVRFGSKSVANGGQSRWTIVLDVTSARSASEAILKQHGISSDRSLVSNPSSTSSSAQASKE